MNRIRRLCTAAAALASAAVSLAAAEPAAPIASDASGYVDFGQLVPSAEGKFVEINLSPGLLKFAATCVAKQEPQASALLSNLKHVRVNVVELSDRNREQTLERVKAVRQELATQGWTPMVNVREQPKGDDVQIFAKMRGDEAIEGLVVTVIDSNHEVVLVNIVGDIKAEQIATLADRFDIDSLKHVKLAKHHHS
ncbi:MAG TPA: DUF4252 domain-containing protein [Opitutaceae bacterium]|nr:DUF4252 domain-containing protein [Opitutaceae bacterium]